MKLTIHLLDIHQVYFISSWPRILLIQVHENKGRSVKTKARLLSHLYKAGQLLCTMGMNTSHRTFLNNARLTAIADNITNINKEL